VVSLLTDVSRLSDRQVVPVLAYGNQRRRTVLRPVSVFLHRGLGEDQPFGDLRVRSSLADRDQDLVFALAQRPQSGVGVRSGSAGGGEDLMGVGVQQTSGQAGCDDRVAGGHRIPAMSSSEAYRDGMEDQLGALGLVRGAIVLWTTRYIDAAVAQLRAEGHEICNEHVARLSPLKHRNLNVLGRYSFTASVPREGLRPQRDPDAVELDDDDDGGEDV
jgi:hypothetical protein